VSLPIPGSLISEGGRKILCELAAASPPGCFVEFGVFNGGSAYELAKVAEEQGREIFLYDTFEGMPYQHPEYDRHKVGDLKTVDYELLQLQIPNAVFVKGIFPDSLLEYMPPIAFCHVDADQYDSIKAAYRVFGPLMVKGGIMVFDDYLALPGATKALDEVAGKENIELTANNKALLRF